MSDRIKVILSKSVAILSMFASLAFLGKYLTKGDIGIVFMVSTIASCMILG